MRKGPSAWVLAFGALGAVSAALAANGSGLLAPDESPPPSALAAPMIEPQAAPTQAIYYVDFNKGDDANNGLSESTAFKTIERARQVVDGVNNAMTGDIVVYLRGGRHELGAPLVFGPGDGGTNGYRVHYRSISASERPVISGGLDLTSGWSDANGDGTWEATVPAGTQSRNFYVNGTPAILARSVAQLANVTITSTGLTTTSTGLANYGNKTDVEFVWQRDWKWKVFSATSITSNGSLATVTMKQPGWNLRDGGIGSVSGAPTFTQNARELLDAPGEWFLDKTQSRVFYRPRPNETMGRTETILARIDNAMVQITGMPSNPVNNLTFDGVSFQHSTYMRPNQGQGHAGQQSNATRNTLTGGNDYITPSDAAVRVRYASGISFENGDFRNLGSSGLWLDTGSKNTSVIGNVFTATGSNAIQIGSFTRVSATTTACVGCIDIPTADEVTAITVANNHIHKVGVEFASASQGIHSGFTKGVVIANNTLHDLGYTGIASGYKWDDVVTDSGNLRIEYNHVYDFMKVGRDGGGIYNLGYQGAGGASLVRYNHVSNINDEYGQLYSDQGSSQIVFEQNVLRYIGAYTWFFDNSLDCGTTSCAQAGLIVRNNFTTSGNQRFTGSLTATGTTTFNVASPPAAAQTIMTNAGLQSAYAALLSYRPPYQAENGVIGGGGASALPSAYGFNGSGVFDFNASGGFVEFKVDAGAGGSGTLAIRYALGATPGRAVSLNINGAVQTFTFQPTGSWSTWTTATVPVTLNSGVNTIRFTSTGQDGGNLDQIQLLGYPV